MVVAGSRSLVLNLPGITSHFQFNAIGQNNRPVQAKSNDLLVNPLLLLFDEGLNFAHAHTARHYDFNSRMSMNIDAQMFRSFAATHVVLVLRAEIQPQLIDVCYHALAIEENDDVVYL